MRLLVVSTYFETHLGGLEMVAARLADELARLGLEVSWLASDTTPAGRHAQVRLEAFAASNLAERRLGFPYVVPGLRGAARLVRAVRRADAVLVHDSLYLPSVIAVLAAKLAGKPVLIVQHIGAVPYRNPLLRGLMALGNALVARPLLARADQVVFISATVRRYFGEVRFRRPPAVIFNGVDAKVFRPAAGPAARAALRRRFGLDGRPAALFVGRFVEKKGLDILREAAAARPDVQWLFAGGGPIDPQGWGLANVTTFAGLAGESLAKLYRASDALVLPSVGEGFPLVIQEALACGLPVICGEETTRADDAAAPLLQAVDVTRPAAEAAAALSRRLDAALAEGPEAADRRRTFAADRYAWTATAAGHRDLLLELTAVREARHQRAWAEAR